MRKFPSKIDSMTDVILCLLIASPVWVLISNSFSDNKIGYLQWLFIPVAALIAWFRFATFYIIDGTELRYQSGPVRGSRDINNIYKVYRTTTDPFNSGNLSSDKISIRTKGRGSLNISPEPKEEFIEALLAVNPQIEVVD